MGSVCKVCALSPPEEEFRVGSRSQVSYIHVEEGLGDTEKPPVASPTKRGLSPGLTPLELKQKEAAKETPKTETPKREPTRKIYASAKPTVIDLQVLEKVEESVKSEPLGLYLLYEAKNNGSWMLQWSKTYLDNAWAFCKPKEVSGVPEYKFQGSKKDQLSMGIHTSKESMAMGVVEFIKHGRRHKSSFTWLPEYSRQLSDKDTFDIVTIGIHNATTEEVSILDSSNPSVSSLDDCDAVVAVVGAGRGLSGLNEMSVGGGRIPRADFVNVGQSAGFGVSFV